MKTKIKKVFSQESLVILGIVVCAVAFFNTPGSMDVSAYWSKWMDYAVQSGIVKGYALQEDMYPPFALILQICLKGICPALSNFQVLRLVNIFSLLLTVLVLQVTYKNSKVSLLSFFGLMLSMNLGYLDIELCPFIILSFYFLTKKKYVSSGIFFTLLCLIKFQPLIIMPYVCIFFVDILRSGRYKFKILIRWKEAFRMGIPAIIIGGGYNDTLPKAISRCLTQGAV